jgi:hypothetical protein
LQFANVNALLQLVAFRGLVRASKLAALAAVGGRCVPSFHNRELSCP